MSAAFVQVYGAPTGRPVDVAGHHLERDAQASEQFAPAGGGTGEDQAGGSASGGPTLRPLFGESGDSRHIPSGGEDDPTGNAKGGNFAPGQ